MSAVRRRYSPGILCRGSLILLFLFSTRAVFAQKASEEQAHAWFDAGDFERARPAFKQILTAQPQNPVALYCMGQMAPDVATAEQYYLRLLYHVPRHPYADDALLSIARLQFQDGRYSDAARTCNRLLVSYPETDLNDQARYWLGRALLSDKQPGLARLTFLQLLTVHPESPYAAQTQLGIGDTFRTEGVPIEAVRAYLKLESAYQGSDSLQVALLRAGQCLETAEKPFEALHVYQRLVDRFSATREAEEARKRVTALRTQSPLPPSR